MNEDINSKLRSTDKNKRTEHTNRKVAKFYRDVEKDDLLEVMKRNAVSNIYVPLRIKEICVENLEYEEEELIGQLLRENSELLDSLDQYRIKQEITDKIIQNFEILFKKYKQEQNFGEGLENIYTKIAKDLDYLKQIRPQTHDNSSFNEIPFEYSEMSFMNHEKDEPFKQIQIHEKEPEKNIHEMDVFQDTIHTVKMPTIHDPQNMVTIKDTKSKEKIDRLKIKISQLKNENEAARETLKEKNQAIEELKDEINHQKIIYEQKLEFTNSMFTKMYERVNPDKNQKEHTEQLFETRKPNTSMKKGANASIVSSQTNLENAKDTENSRFICPSKPECLEQISDIQKNFEIEKQMIRESFAIDMESKIKENNPSNSSQIEDLELKLIEYREKYQSKKHTLKEYEQKIECLHSKISSVEEELRTANDLNLNLKRENNTLIENTSKQESQHNIHTNRYKQLESTVSDYELQIDQYCMSIQNLNLEIKELNSKVNSYQNEIKPAKDENELREYNSRKELLKTEELLADCNIELNLCKHKLEKANEQLKDQENTINTQQKELNSVKTKHEAEISQLKTQLKSFENCLAPENKFPSNTKPEQIRLNTKKQRIKRLRKETKTIKTCFRSLHSYAKTSFSDLQTVFIIQSTKINSFIAKYQSFRKMKSKPPKNRVLKSYNPSASNSLSLDSDYEKIKFELYYKEKELKELQYKYDSERNNLTDANKHKEKLIKPSSTFTNNEKRLMKEKEMQLYYKNQLKLIQNKLEFLESGYAFSLSSFEMKIKSLKSNQEAEIRGIVSYFQSIIENKSMEQSQNNEQLENLNEKNTDLLNKAESELRSLQRTIKLTEDKSRQSEFIRQSEIRSYQKESKALKNQIQHMAYLLKI